MLGFFFFFVTCIVAKPCVVEYSSNWRGGDAEGVFVMLHYSDDIMYMDEFVTYNAIAWTREFAVEGATMTIRGRFPFTRHSGFSTYDGPELATLYDYLPAREIVPDVGSVNPEQPGEYFYALNRSFTITLRFGDPARNRINENENENNVLFAPNGTSGAFAYRVYLLSAGTNITGDVEFLSVESSTESCPLALICEPPLCRNNNTADCVQGLYYNIPNHKNCLPPLSSSTGQSDGAVAAAAAAVTMTRETREDGSPPAYPPEDDECFSYEDCSVPLRLYQGLDGRTANPTNPTAKYFMGYIDLDVHNNSSSNNDDNDERLLMVGYFKAFTVPDTYDALTRTVVGVTGEENMIYWSLCAYGGRGDVKILPLLGCVCDNLTRPDAHGYVGVVFGFAEETPERMHELDVFLPLFDKFGIFTRDNPNGSIAIRHVLPHPEYVQFSAWNADLPANPDVSPVVFVGEEYYPKIVYCYREEYHRDGCRTRFN